jgi:hypothetical protein
VLCKSNVESMSHVLVLCLYARKVSKIVKDKLGVNFVWNIGSLEDFLRN